MFDAHCHLDDPRLPGGVEESLRRARAKGVKGFIIPGVRPSTWGTQADIAARHDDVWATIGLHPWAVTAALKRGETLQRELEKITEVLAGGGPVAIGELGLDGLPRNRSTLPQQKEVFRHQLALARALNLPVVLHIVRAHGAAIDILKGDGLPQAGGMVHSMSGSEEVGAIYVGLGLHLSFGGNICNERESKAHRAARSCPSHRILIETDAPDQSPSPKGAGLNEPGNLPIILRHLSSLRGEKESTLEARTEANTRALFGL